MKKLMNLTSVITLSKTEQKTINGGLRKFCSASEPCPPEYTCNGCHCDFT